MSNYELNHRRNRRALLRTRAHLMRGLPSPAESAFWRAVRARRLGVQFRRQYPVGNFITDFCVLSARLIIEIDGSWHDRRGAADRRRDHALGRAGWRVLRFFESGC